MTIPEIVELFQVNERVVRGWVERDLLKPVRREGRGRCGQMWFARGEVAALVYGLCPVCGNGFKKATIKQRFCGDPCRKKSNYMHKGEV